MKFKPEDFLPYGTAMCAEIANEMLQKWLDQAPVVYGNNDAKTYHWCQNTDTLANVTHRARLVCIEELVKEPCKHEANYCWEIRNKKANWYECSKCGVKLVLEQVWKEKK